MTEEQEALIGFTLLWLAIGLACYYGVAVFQGWL